MTFKNATMDLMKETFAGWGKDNASQLAAALAYYTIFSLAPLLIIVIGVAGLVLGRSQVQTQILGQIEGLVGESGAGLVQTMMQNMFSGNTGIIATLVGFVALFFGATGVLMQLQSALNVVWKVGPQQGQGIMTVVKDRLISFSMILGIGFLLILSFIISAGLSVASTFLTDFIPSILGQIETLDLSQVTAMLDYVGQYINLSQFFSSSTLAEPSQLLDTSQINTQVSSALLIVNILHLVNFVASFMIITVLFAMIFKVLPSITVTWRDIWPGAALTALLFTIGKTLIGIYLGSASVGSAYGAAGSLVIILVWVYYSAQILLLGAEFTQVYARKYGSLAPSASNAPDIPVNANSLSEQNQQNASTSEAKQRPSQQIALSSQVSLSNPSKEEKANLGVVDYVGVFLGFIAVLGLSAFTGRRK